MFLRVPSVLSLPRRSFATARVESLPHQSPYKNRITIGNHQLLADEPKDVKGGEDLGPSPYDFLMCALGSCTSMTLHMFASRKGIPLEQVLVDLKHDKIHAQDCEKCEGKTGLVDRISVQLELIGTNLTSEHRATLLDIASKCPVHKTLLSNTVLPIALKN